MRVIVIILLFILSGVASAQYEYFNGLYPHDGTIEGGNGIFTQVLHQDSLYYVAGVNFENNAMNFFINTLNNTGVIESYSEFHSSIGLAGTFGNGFSYRQDNAGFYHLGGGYNQNDEIVEFVFSLNEGFTLDWIYELISNSPDTIRHQLFVAETVDQGVLISGIRIYDMFPSQVGDTFSNILLFKLNTDGEVLWENEINYTDNLEGSVDQLMMPLQLQPIVDERALIFSSILDNFNSTKVIVKVDSLGNLLDWHEWGDGVYHEWVPFGLPKSDSTVMVTYQKGYGYIVPDDYFAVESKLHLMEFNFEAMEPLWDIEYDVQFDVNHLYDFLPAIDGGYYLCGGSSSNQSGVPIEGIPDVSNGVAYILKTDSVGEFEWLKYYYFTNVVPNENGELQELYSFDNTPDGGIIGVGYQYSGGNQNPWAIKLDACGDLEDLGCPGPPNVSVVDYEAVQNSILEIYPNPSNDQVTLEYAKARIHQGYMYKIYNQQGQLMFKKKFNGYKTIDISSWSSGLYLVQILDRKENLVEVGKLMVE